MGIFATKRMQQDLSPQVVLAGLLIAVKGEAVSELERMHLAAQIAGPSTDAVMVDMGELRHLLDEASGQLLYLGFESFLARADQLLTPRQKLAVLVNIIDLCLCENSMFDGDRAVFDRIRQVFAVDEDALRPYEDLLVLKNETSIRLNVMPTQYSRAAEAFRSLV